MLIGDQAGREIATDIPSGLGGAGGEASPGWLTRAGLAACTATCIVMAAASDGVEIDGLEVTVASRSDARGLLLMNETDGAPVYAGPRDLELIVRLEARGADSGRLAAIVESGRRRSAVLAAMEDALPVTVRIETGPD